MPSKLFKALYDEAYLRDATAYGWATLMITQDSTLELKCFGKGYWEEFPMDVCVDIARRCQVELNGWFNSELKALLRCRKIQILLRTGNERPRRITDPDVIDFDDNLALQKAMLSFLQS